MTFIYDALEVFLMKTYNIGSSGDLGTGKNFAKNREIASVQVAPRQRVT